MLVGIRRWERLSGTVMICVARCSAACGAVGATTPGFVRSPASAVGSGRYPLCLSPAGTQLTERQLNSQPPMPEPALEPDELNRSQGIQPLPGL